MIQFITHGNSPEEHLDTARIALDSGISWIQLRLKYLEYEKIRHWAAEFKSLCDSYNATACLNDYAEVAAEQGYEALHLGKKDEAPGIARQRFTNKVIIGGTSNTYSDILGIHEHVDYVGFGPLRFTATKAVLSPILGIDGYREVIDKLMENDINIPIIAIGGITDKDVKELSEIGLAGVAVSGYLIKTGFDRNIIENMQAAFSAYNPIQHG